MDISLAYIEIWEQRRNNVFYGRDATPLIFLIVKRLTQLSVHVSEDRGAKRVTSLKEFKQNKRGKV